MPPHSASGGTARDPSPGVEPGDTLSELREERDSLREQVTQLHRAKLAGDVLAGIAHDLKSALTGLMWCCEALEKRVGNDPSLATGLADVVTGARYARSLSLQLSTIGKNVPSVRTSVNLNALLTEAMALVEMLRPKNVRVEKNFQTSHCRVWGDEAQLTQIVLNLASNAFDAMRADGGLLQVGLTHEVDSDGSQWHLLTFEDSGPGMSAEVCARAREPFFSTKTAADGTGLGLCVVTMTAEKHDGTVQIESQVGHGTAVQVRLPCR